MLGLGFLCPRVLGKFLSHSCFWAGCRGECGAWRGCVWFYLGLSPCPCLSCLCSLSEPGEPLESQNPGTGAGVSNLPKPPLAQGGDGGQVVQQAEGAGGDHPAAADVPARQEQGSGGEALALPPEPSAGLSAERMVPGHGLLAACLRRAPQPVPVPWQLAAFSTATSCPCLDTVSSRLKSFSSPKQVAACWWQCLSISLSCCSGAHSNSALQAGPRAERGG